MSLMSDELSNRLNNRFGSNFDYAADLNSSFPTQEQTPSMWDMIKAGDYSGAIDSIPVVNTIMGTRANMLGGLEGMVGDVLNGAGAELKAADEAGREGSLVDSVRNSNTGFLGRVGDSLLNNGHFLRNSSDDIQQRYGSLNKYQNMGLLSRLTSPDYITDRRGLMADASNGFGSSIPFLIAGSAMPEIGGAKLMRGAASLAERLGAERAASLLGSETAQGIGSTAAKWGLVNGPLDAFSNSAEMYDDLKSQGLSDREIASKMNAATLEELPQDAISEGLFGVLSSGKVFGNMFKGSNTARRALGNALNVPVEMASEYVQEGNQQRLNNKYEGKEYGSLFYPTEDEAAAAAQGAIGAMPTALFGAVHGFRRRGSSPSPSPEPADTQTINDVLNGGAPSNGGVSDVQSETNSSDISQGVNTLPGTNLIDFANSDPAAISSLQNSNTDIEVPQNSANSGTHSHESAGSGLSEGASEWLGKTMDNGVNGCVEAVTKIGSKSSPFLADELGKGVASVPKLVEDAGSSVIDFDPSKVEAGDVIVYGDNDHVVLADGKGGYIGNSSSQNKVVAGDNYNEMGGLTPTKIIKTGGQAASTESNGESADNTAADSSVPDDKGGQIARQIAQNTGLPVNLIWAQMYHESGNFDSRVAREDHNYGGVKGTDNNYLHFDNDQEFVDYMSSYLPKYKEDGIYDAKNVDEYAAALQHGGYFGSMQNVVGCPDVVNS